ncbi:sugar-binding domain-containing protein [Acidicapsa dinghuensis]|uniref:Sugar-binding domain-containing protein n=1 Tax=Acidicapsa dinghuensis TaxID=2218256 RepID=A0ABW1EK29_9BACT|nr:sugar-binding domain-containing protein [Acidicapsa dinghuensis]
MIDHQLKRLNRTLPSLRICTEAVIAFALCCIATSLSAETSTALQNGWRLQSACKIQATGEAITSKSFATDGWIETSVPSTVLAAQVKAGVVPDPYYGDNLRHLDGVSYPVGHNFSNLPMPDDSPYKCGWWYRTEFAVPAATEHEARTWLHFGGINYRAEIWVNGHRVADETTVAGAYRTYDFDVTEWVKRGEKNVLAVETFAPTEKDLGINWVDWNPCPPDKDMGLWGGVDLVTTGAVTVRSPLAVTHFTDDSLTTAELTVYAELHNSTNEAVKGVVSGTAAGAKFEQAVELAPHEDRTVVFTPEKFATLKVHGPKIWWPYQMGEPHLEKLTVSFAAQGKQTDEQSVDFGIREITAEHTVDGYELFRVNHKRILVRGAGWSQDMLLRTEDHRLRDQLELVKAMNLNTIRLEGKLEVEEFFHLADQQGILVMLGWCCCDHWEHWKDWKPEDLTIATASLHSQMLRLRQHPSLLVWLNGSDNPPPANVESAYLQVEKETHWPNPILSSASGTPTTVTGASGVKMMGPYDYVAPSYWYVDKHNGGAYGFNTETSPGPAIPSLASRKKFLTDPEAWPPTADWELHNGGGGFATLKVFDGAMEAVYGKPQSAAEYERIAQTMEYDSERAMFEAYGKNKYTSTGVIQWMLNNAWPSMIWHLYDYYLDAGAGYFAAKKACEPVHIQYSYDDESVVVVNSTYATVEGLHASVDVHDLNWKELYSAQRDLTAGVDSSQRVFEIPDKLFKDAERTFFIDLKLTDANGKMVSRNFYWVPAVLTSFDWNETNYTHTPAYRHEDLTALAHLPAANVTATAETVSTAKGREVRVHLNNGSGNLAFQVHAAIRTASDDLVAPVFWSDNWIELTPGESTVQTALLPENAPADVKVIVDGWNVASATLTPTAAMAAK